MAYVAIGPTHVLVGDPTRTAGTGFPSLGDTENVSIDLGIKIAYTSSAQRQGAAQADSIYYMTPEPVAQVELKDIEPATFDLLVLNGVLHTSGNTFGFGDSFTKMGPSETRDLPTVAFIPETEKASAEAAAHGIWFARAYTGGLSGIQYGRVTEGEINQPYTIEIRSAYASQDQASQTISVGYRMGWMGPPSNAGTFTTPWTTGTIT